ncbi:PREDICTED: putative gustatory receptor 28b [Trachymyrmex septentrionalis]|uniref:putative gustatory receptor 28b n=1 Tax=Trachymyrmex septentrionalis TaxID=34720 RepID=UPI00084F7AC8|nr:PREDICTED: putative gustatory receptor 28b [Trachymyrmex septentrionalis]
MFSSSSKLQRWANGKMQKKWELFHATNFESLMYPSFTCCYMLGMFPYKINALGFEISTPRYILSTIVICICIIFLLYVLYLINFCINGSVPTNLNRNSFYILSGFTAVVTYILSGPRMHLLQTIKDISSKLPSELYQKLSKLIHAKDLLGSLFLLLEVPIYYKMNIHFIIKIYIIYITLLTFHMDMLYMNCVCILKACFKRINDNLENMWEYTMVYHFDKICYKQRSSLLLIELKALKKQHLMISNTVQMLNIIFSLQLLATVIITFTRITFNFYYQILYWQRGVTLINVEDYIYNTYLTMSLMYYFIKITLIVWACKTGKDQALQIGTIVHDVLNSIDDNEIKYELQLFSLQILHHDNSFSAKSLTMDATLLTAIIGSVSTYLLILIQFFKMKYYCNDEIARNVTQIIH